jgi:uncharacterized membrane protein YphA (DoxX/SURF4 family)
MKKTKILFWIFTVLFGGFMLMTGIQNIMMTPESIDLITTQLGYPQYMIPFLGVAKTLGVIGIVIPGFPRLKEWAYAGLFFDITGAVYSMICAHGFDPMMLTLLVPVGMGILSYIYHHKLLRGE